MKNIFQDLKRKDHNAIWVDWMFLNILVRGFWLR